MIFGNIKFLVNAQENPVNVRVPGDLNNDERVTLQDLIIFANAYGSSPNQSNWNPIADIDDTLHIDALDLSIMRVYYGHGIPTIIVLSNNLPLSGRSPWKGIMTETIIAEHAERCILSYTIVYYPPMEVANGSVSSIFNGTDWMNETMTKNGDYFNGTIDTNWMPGIGSWGSTTGTFIYYKTIAYDSFGYSNETPTTYFYIYPDPH
jgi:hypothetical protein